MPQFLVALLVVALCSVVTAQTYFEQTFDGGGTPGGAEVVPFDGRGSVAHIAVAADQPNPGRTAVFTLPVDEMRGNAVFFGADVRAANVSEKPNNWNGVKVMLIIKTPSGTNHPQPEIPVGSFDWKRFSSTTNIPADATSVQLVLGLERVSGEVWFDNVRVTHRKTLAPVPAADPSKPIFRGHDLPRLRGAMAGHRLTEADIEHFANNWNGNLFRWQLFESARQDRPLEKYDEWLDAQLDYFDKVLEWCRKHRVMVVLDLHSPPGGQAFSAGYVTARGRIFSEPAAQAKFVEVWEKMARRYKGNPVIWGYDLLNEPDDTMVTEGSDDWQTLALRAGKAIRAIDPDRTLIIEPNGWGGPGAFATFQPLDLPNCVYSFHMYAPHQFTHQGVHSNPTGFVYPGEVAGQHWDKAALRKTMQPAVDFANRYRVHMYVGEFSAIRNAPENSAARYLADVTAIFEELGYDWTYHAYREWAGWSVEHIGPLDKPEKSPTPTEAEKALTHWMKQNQKPKF